MVLIADSGSTKCSWIAGDGAHPAQLRTRGINAVQHTAEQIREVLGELPPCDGVTAVRFYGAGCGPTFPEASEKLRRELEAHFKTDDIAIESDLLGAAGATGRASPASSAQGPTPAGTGTTGSCSTSPRWVTCWATKAAEPYWGVTW